MERTQIYFTKRQKKFFKKESEKLQIPYSELVRRVLDGWIEKQKRKES